MRMGCPFHWCNAIVEVIETGPEPWPGGVVRHIIQLHPVGHPALQGNCPASLLDWPLNMTTYLYLFQTEYNRAQREVEAWQQNQYERAGEVGQPLPTSQPIKHPGRMGREPHHRSPAWVLGGRQDEDVVASGDERRGTVPLGVDGQQVGESGMLSELAGLVNAAGAAGAEARVSIAQAIDALERARAAINEAVGQSHSETLTEYSGLLYRAISECQSAQGQIDTGHDLAQAYIAQISGAE